jgi:hypothetical protein
VRASGTVEERALQKREAPSAMRRTPRPSTLSKKATAGANGKGVKEKGVEG